MRRYLVLASFRLRGPPLSYHQSLPCGILLPQSWNASTLLKRNPHQAKCNRRHASLRTPKEKRSRHGSSLINSRDLPQALDPSIKRYAQTKRLLARRSLRALEFLCDFTCAGFFASQRLQVSHIRRRQERRFPCFTSYLLVRKVLYGEFVR